LLRHSLQRSLLLLLLLKLHHHLLLLLLQLWLHLRMWWRDLTKLKKPIKQSHRYQKYFLNWNIQLQ
jgi:hypothetical protein